jgi:L-alanine-DL-glutamate epimerase-like enolase superfamily enzyme
MTGEPSIGRGASARFETAHAILASARTVGVAVKAGGTFDTAIGRRHLLAFATLTGVSDAEAAPPSTCLAADVADYPPLSDGMVTPDYRPGIGVEPDTERLEELEISRCSGRLTQPAVPAESPME